MCWPVLKTLKCLHISLNWLYIVLDLFKYIRNIWIYGVEFCVYGAYSIRASILFRTISPIVPQLAALWGSPNLSEQIEVGWIAWGKCLHWSLYIPTLPEATPQGRVDGIAVLVWLGELYSNNMRRDAWASKEMEIAIYTRTLHNRFIFLTCLQVLPQSDVIYISSLYSTSWAPRLPGNKGKIGKGYSWLFVPKHKNPPTPQARGFHLMMRISLTKAVKGCLCLPGSQQQPQHPIMSQAVLKNYI